MTTVDIIVPSRGIYVKKEIPVPEEISDESYFEFT